MKVSVNWLRELVDVKLPVEELAHVLTMGGLEVEEITPLGGAFTKVVVAHVKAVNPHPNADKLRVTEVDAGTGETLTIVCGAPNVAAGQKVPCALIGAKVGDLEIKKAKLRGVESSGMLCSARELGLSQDHAGLLVLEDDAPVGRDIREHLALDDVYLTLKLTPNRGDCLSMFGIARDVAALTGATLRLPVPAPVAAKIADTRKVTLTEATNCARFTGRIIRGMNPKAATPAWMVRRIERAGLRAISPLVDITNYVMLERGQPMHAYDEKKLKGDFDVRDFRAGEKLQLLNEQWVEYRPKLLAITDESGPVGLGGVMGGHATMVGEGTTDVFFEAAFFPPQAVQGRAKELGLTSDAAYRYERGVDFNAQRGAQERAAQLALEICGGSPGPVIETVGNLPAREPVRVRTDRARKVLGYDIADAKMAQALTRLQCAVQGTEPMKVTPPSWRFDLAMEEDFIEEIARVHGYEHIPAMAPRSSLPMLPVVEGSRRRYDLRRILADLGYLEVVNYSFVAAAWEQDFAANAKPVRLANPIASTMDVMRSTLIGGLVSTLASNLNRGEAQVRIFEIGRCFEGETADLAVQPERIAGLAYGGRVPEQWGAPADRVDFFDVKGDLEALAGVVGLEFAPAAHPAFHPGRCAGIRVGGKAIGVLGELHPRLQQRYELPLAPVLFELLTGPLLAAHPARFTGVSRMPAVRRDLSFTVASEVSAGAILGAVRARVSPSVREVEVFDLYQGSGVGSGRKSLALRIVMQDTDRTLTDSEVEGVVTSIRDQLIEQFQAQPRT